MMRILSPLLFALLALLAALAPAPAAAERIRDLGQFEGLRSNQLTGYGVVVGLQGTGDNNLQYVTEAMRGVSGRLGLQLPPGVSPILRNAAAVIVTAALIYLFDEVNKQVLQKIPFSLPFSLRVRVLRNLIHQDRALVHDSPHDWIRARVHRDSVLQGQL